MLKNIRLAAVGFTLCFAMAAGAQGTVQIGSDGSVKVNSGGSQVKVGGGKVKVQTQDSSTTVETDEAEDDADEADTKTTSASSSSSTSKSSSNVSITGSGRKETIACSENTMVSISGATNELTFTGNCKGVSVSGSMNKVTLDGVGKLSVSGTGNNITWKRALGDAKKPKVAVTGFNNKVSKAE
jgi:hypothetical protein